MEQWSEIRRRVLKKELSKRQACVEYKINWKTLQKMLTNDEPPGYRRQQARPKPVLSAVLPLIHEMLEADRQAPRKQRHTARRIYHRLQAEHGYAGCESIVRAAVHDWKHKQKEVFVPLSHLEGEAQVDFGEAEVIIAGERTPELVAWLGRELGQTVLGTEVEPFFKGFEGGVAEDRALCWPLLGVLMRTEGRKL